MVLRGWLTHAGMPWELLVRQTASAATPTNTHPRDSWASVGSPADPSAPNFSVLGQLRTRYGPGPYTLKMMWPKELPGDNMWEQSSPPDQALGKGERAEGYKALSIKYNGPCTWKGLQRCEGTTAYICNLSADGQWYFPIGTDVEWAGGQVSFPGPCSAGLPNDSVTVVELWLWVVEPWGWPLIAVLLLAAAAYVGGGVLLAGRRNGAVRGSGGLTATLMAHPHWGQWMRVKGMVQDGVNFARGGGGGMRSSGGGGGGGGGDAATEGGRGGSRSPAKGSSKSSSSKNSGKPSKKEKEKKSKGAKQSREAAAESAREPLLLADHGSRAGADSGEEQQQGECWRPTRTGLLLAAGARETGVKVDL